MNYVWQLPPHFNTFARVFSFCFTPYRVGAHMQSRCRRQSCSSIAELENRALFTERTMFKVSDVPNVLLHGASRRSLGSLKRIRQSVKNEKVDKIASS